MHYVVHVLDDGSKTLDKRMAPHEEWYGETDKRQEVSVGHWDWWVVGGRWEGYFGGVFDHVTAGEILDGTAEPRFDAPYAFIDLDGNWHAKEIYLPSGFLDEEHGRGTPKRSYFLPVPGYTELYRKFLEMDRGVRVITVDIHS